MNISTRPPFPFDLVGFDLDGTMVDTTGDIAAALNNTLGLIGRGPLHPAQVHTMVGGGTRSLLTQALAATGGLDGVDVEGLLAAQLSFYEQNIALHSQAFDGLVAALDALDEQGVRYAVATNKLEHLARLLLKELGLLDRIAFVIGGDTLGDGRSKPAPDMLLAMKEACGGVRTAFVGDTIYDVSAARAAGCTSIVMDFSGNAADLGADHLITHFDDLVPLLQRL